MTNRLIWLFIILAFILLWLGYYYWVEKNPINIKKEENIKIQAKKIIKKISLEKIEKTKTKESLLSLTEEEAKNIEIKNNNKILEKIKKILKLNSIKNLKIQKIEWNENLFLITLSEKNIFNFIYNDRLLKLENLKLNIKINYIKYLNNNLYIITEKWFFIKKNKKLEYFPTFSDFVINNWEYIWIIKNSDKNIKNNFNYSEFSWDLIVLYNPKKSIKRILYKPNFEIKKILLEKKQVIIVNNEEDRFLLDY